MEQLVAYQGRKKKWQALETQIKSEYVGGTGTGTAAILID